MLVTTGNTHIRGLIKGSETNLITKIKVGTDSTAADVAQTDLIGPILTAACAVYLGPISGQITFQSVFQAEGSTIREVGLFSEDGVMITRKVVGITIYTSGTLFIVSIVLTLS